MKHRISSCAWLVFAVIIMNFDIWGTGGGAPESAGRQTGSGGRREACSSSQRLETRNSEGLKGSAPGPETESFVLQDLPLPAL
ncbi:hypothetical protein AOLI_G00051910 [Acnodon oligacanthus]